MNRYEMLIRRSHSDLPPVASDVVWYYAPSKQTLYSQTNVAMHRFKDGVGAIKYSSPLTSMPDTLRGTAITNVEMPNTITEIGTSAFYNCTSLALTSLPNGVTSIGNSAFFGCTSLALTSLPNGITSINNQAFRACTSLALTSLPSGITSIGTSAFFGCTSLALTSLPSGVKTISSYAFYNCTSLALTSLPSGVTSIYNGAFYNCTGLTSITFEGVPNTINSGAFAGCTNLLDMYCPWYEGDVADAPWGATNATVHYLGASIPTDYILYDELKTAVNPLAGTFVEKSNNWTFATAPDGTKAAYNSNTNTQSFSMAGIKYTGSLSSTDSLTCSIWCYCTREFNTQPPDWLCPIGAGDKSGSGVAFEWGYSGNLEIPWISGWSSSDTTLRPTNDEWHHLLFTFQQGGYLNLYVDGVLHWTSSTTKTITIGSNSLYVGTRFNDGRPWVGYLRNAIIYNRVLNTTERKAIYFAGIGDEESESSSSMSESSSSASTAVELCDECGEPLNAKGWCVNPECDGYTVVCEHCGERLEGVDEGWDTPRCPNEDCEAWVHYCGICGTEQEHDEDSDEWFCPNSGCSESPYYEEPDDEGGDEEEGDGEEEEE